MFFLSHVQLGSKVLSLSLTLLTKKFVHVSLLNELFGFGLELAKLISIPEEGLVVKHLGLKI